MRNIHRWTAIAVGGALALGGCGGDGGDDGDGGGGVPLTAITTDNAAQVSAVVFQAASALFDVASSSGTLPLGTVAKVAGGSGRVGLVGFSAQQIKAAAKRRPLAVRTVAAADEQTFDCSGGGTVTERINDADNNGVVSVGDSLRLTFNNCVEDGITSNGVLAWNLTLLSEASIGAKVSFGSFSINDGTDTIEADGGFDLTVTQTPGVSEQYGIAGETLASTLNGDRHVITDFAGTASSDLVASTVSYTFSGRVSDSSKNVSVDAATLTDFVTQTADDFPRSGSLRSIGAANSQALLQALSSTTVQISVDPEGDGSFTTPVEWSWSALEGLTD